MHNENTLILLATLLSVRRLPILGSLNYNVAPINMYLHSSIVDRIFFTNRWRRIVAVKRITMQVYRRYTSVGHVSLGIVATSGPRYIPRAIPRSEI